MAKVKGMNVVFIYVLDMAKVRKFYESAFDLLNPIQVGQALSLAKALVLDTRAEVFSGNTSLPMATVRDVLQCYQLSMQVDDHHAHCWFKIRLTFDLTVTRFEVESDDSGKSFVFPCRCSASHAYGIHYDHPGAVYDQLERRDLPQEWWRDCRQNARPRSVPRTR